MIVVLANCQAPAWRWTLSLIFPHTEVRAFSFADMTSPARAEVLRQALGEAELAFSLDFDDGYGDFAASRIGSITRRSIIVPAFDFLAFHPDLIYLQDAAGRHEQTPLGDYNSLICAAAFAIGLDEDRTLRLYNALVYRRLGFFNLFERNCAALTARFAECGYDISNDLRCWARRGPFMMSVNHPRSFVTSDIIKLVCLTHRVGTVRDIDYSDFFPDELTNSSIFPVYPEIAAALNLSGSYLFKAPADPAGYALMDLADFVAGSFARYRRSSPEGWIDEKCRLPESKRILIRLTS